MKITATKVDRSIDTRKTEYWLDIEINGEHLGYLPEDTPRTKIIEQAKYWAQCLDMICWEASQNEYKVGSAAITMIENMPARA